MVCAFLMDPILAGLLVCRNALRVAATGLGLKLPLFAAAEADFVVSMAGTIHRGIVLGEAR
jgi:hypothetical protein